MEGQWRLSPIWFKRKGKARKMVNWGIFHPNPPFFPSKLGVKGDGNQESLKQMQIISIFNPFIYLSF